MKIKFWSKTVFKDFLALCSEQYTQMHFKTFLSIQNIFSMCCCIYIYLYIFSYLTITAERRKQSELCVSCFEVMHWAQTVNSKLKSFIWILATLLLWRVVTEIGISNSVFSIKALSLTVVVQMQHCWRRTRTIDPIQRWWKPRVHIMSLFSFHCLRLKADKKKLITSFSQQH